MWEGNIDWLPPIRTPTRDQTCNLGICPDWDSNPQPFGVKDEAPTNWTTLARADRDFKIAIINVSKKIDKKIENFLRKLNFIKNTKLENRKWNINELIYKINRYV